jgi:hypothetical protein
MYKLLGSSVTFSDTLGISIKIFPVQYSKLKSSEAVFTNEFAN